MFYDFSTMPVKLPIQKPGGIIQILTEISPYKKEFWKNRNPETLTIDLENSLWPLKMSGEAVNIIFPDIEAAIDFFSDRFREINILPKRAGFDRIDNSESGIPVTINIFEAKTLYHSLSDLILPDKRYYAIKIKEEPHFVICISSKSTVEEIIRKIETISKTSISDLIAYNPVTGKVIDGNASLPEEAQFIFFGAKPKTFDYPFPYRRLRRKETVRLRESSFCPALPCNNCLGCTSVCPSGLSPNILYHLIINNETDEINQYEIDLCIRCGRCSVVCPSDIPLFTGITDYLNKKEKEEDDDDS